jgi:hypothetical protein
MSFQQAQADVMQTTTENMPWYDGGPPEFVFTCSWQTVLAEPAVANLYTFGPGIPTWLFKQR